MKKSVLITLMALLVVLPFVLSACSSASGPELTVRAYLEAVNAGDKAKFVGVWLPDNQATAITTFENYTLFKIKYTQIKKIVSEDLQGNPDLQTATAEVVEESSLGTHAKTLKFGLKRQDGQWFIFSPPY